MTDFTPAFIAAARASTQTTFELTERPASGALIVTEVDDAPLQLSAGSVAMVAGMSARSSSCRSAQTRCRYPARWCCATSPWPKR